VLIFIVISHAVLFAQQSEKPEGHYNLYRQDGPAEKVGEIIITSWKGNSFLIRGAGWIGSERPKTAKDFTNGSWMTAGLARQNLK
jgi:hypothetical protein